MSKKVIFVDGGESSLSPKTLFEASNTVTLCIPGDISVIDAVNLVVEFGLDYDDSTTKRSVEYELLILDPTFTSSDKTEEGSIVDTPNTSFFGGFKSGSDEHDISTGSLNSDEDVEELSDE